MSEPVLGEMLRELRAVSDAAWGRYAFSRDFLRDKVPPELRDEMIGKAIVCGAEWAVRMRGETHTSDPAEMAEAFGLEVAEIDSPPMEKRVLLAQFVPENRIELMLRPLESYAALYRERQQDGESAPLFPAPEQIRSLLLAHEIFHFVEDRHEQEIYTRTETIRLWKFFRFENHSTVRAVGEIAAMSFAKELTGADFSPFLLDILLFFACNRAGAEAIFRDVMSIAGAEGVAARSCQAKP